MARHSTSVFSVSTTDLKNSRPFSSHDYRLYFSDLKPKIDLKFDKNDIRLRPENLMNRKIDPAVYVTPSVDGICYSLYLVYTW